MNFLIPNTGRLPFTTNIALFSPVIYYISFDFILQTVLLHGTLFYLFYGLKCISVIKLYFLSNAQCI